MSRSLTKKEQQNYLNNRDILHSNLTELQADLEDLSIHELIDCRQDMLIRVNRCLEAILETDEDNMD